MAKPIVDGLENDLQDRARVLRLNLMNPVGMQAARRFGVRAVPTFVVFDGQGRATATQVGLPNRGKLVADIQGLLLQP